VRGAPVPIGAPETLQKQPLNTREIGGIGL